MGRGSAAISKAKREAFLKKVAEEEQPFQPALRRCTDCGKALPLDRFGTRKTRTKSGPISITPRSVCKRCESERSKRYKERKIAEGTWTEIRRPSQERFSKTKKAREYQREWRAAKRVELGAAPPDPSTPRPGATHWSGLPVEPLAQFIEHLQAYRSINEMELATGIDHRRFGAILTREYEKVSLDIADRILTKLGYPEELHLLYPAEDEQIIGYGYVLEDAA